MRKILFFLLAIISVCHAQEDPAAAAKISPDLPHIVPPSPTVAALMKFEEYPVNNYTGIPDISIPFGNFTAIDNKLSVNLALSYHPASAAPKEVASNVGLGWSFFAGGTISRSVRGLQDDLNSTSTKVGIRDLSNRYPEYANCTFLHESACTMSLSEQNNYKFEAGVKGKYDTEYDLYQYNFMGYSGRFFVNRSNEVVKLDKNTLKISYDAGADIFTIRDENGYIYLFDIKETSQETYSSATTAQNGVTESEVSSSSGTYVSAYHLTSVKNVEGSLLVKLTYADPTQEKTKTSSQTQAEMLGLNVNDVIEILQDRCYNNFQTAVNRLQPRKQVNYSSVVSNTRKLKEIEIIGKAKIKFYNTTSRQDYNLLEGSLALALDEIYIAKNLHDTVYTNYLKYKLDYSYSNVVEKGKRLSLKSVTKSNFVDNKKEVYKFYYDDFYDYLGYGYSEQMGTDYWGYYNGSLEGNFNSKETSKDLCTTEMLQKITYPTGGSAVFNFESNTYSYVGTQPVNNFDENPDNWNIVTTNISTPDYGFTLDPLIPHGYSKLLFLQLENERMSIRLIVTAPQNFNHSLSLYGQLSSGAWVFVRSLNCSFYPCECEIGYDNTPYIGYKIVYIDALQPETDIDGGGILLDPSNAPSSGSAFVNINTKTRLYPDKKWLYGGGVRIKDIAYFANDSVNKNYYKFLERSIEQESGSPIKEKHYRYQFFDTISRSSGALVASKPVYSYAISRRHGIAKGPTCSETMGPDLMTDSYQYKVTITDGSPKVQSKGGFVGYENVLVYETANGKSEYKYKSPRLVLNDDYVQAYPFIPYSGKDYEKGLILEEKHYDESSTLLKSSLYEYEFENYSIQTGFKFFGLDCPFAASYGDYANYSNSVLLCSNQTLEEYCEKTCGAITSFLHESPVIEKFGWAKLTKKTSLDYFYDSGVQKIVKNVQEYGYDSFNMKPSWEITYLDSSLNPKYLRTEYDYYAPPNFLTTNRIAELQEVTQYRNSKQISKTNTRFFQSAPYYPQSVSISKGPGSLEEKVEFISYDSFGHILEAKKTNGITYSYIWGYNKSQPIAMIENATNAQIASALGTSSISNLTESNLGDINDLRTTMPNARITTFTYDPLVGVTTQTDPRGYITTYEYDSFGRLKLVKDQDNNIISENEYHYKNQPTE